MPDKDPTIGQLVDTVAAAEAAATQQKIVLRAPSKLIKSLVTQVLSQHITFCDKNLGEIYGIPVVDLQGIYRFKPQIRLVFYPTRTLNNDSPNIRYHNPSEISFRLVDKTELTITKGDTDTLKSKINELFGGAKPLVWHKGKTQYVYDDDSLGYRFRILCIDEPEAKKIITKVMEIRQHTPDWKKLFINTNSEPDITYPDTPAKETILGEVVIEPRFRPDVKVQFSYAEVYLHGKKKPKRL